MVHQSDKTTLNTFYQELRKSQGLQDPKHDIRLKLFKQML